MINLDRLYLIVTTSCKIPRVLASIRFALMLKFSRNIAKMMNRQRVKSYWALPTSCTPRFSCCTKIFLVAHIFFYFYLYALLSSQNMQIVLSIRYNAIAARRVAVTMLFSSSSLIWKLYLDHRQDSQLSSDHGELHDSLDKIAARFSSNNLCLAIS